MDVCAEHVTGMNIRWDYFVNQYDTARYVSGDGVRDNKHIQFVRELASVVSILQVRPHQQPCVGMVRS